MPKPADKNYFQGLEINFKGTKIYFRGSEIYFKTTEIVLSPGVRKFSPSLTKLYRLPKREMPYAADGFLPCR